MEKEMINPIRRVSDEEVSKIKKLMNNGVSYEDAQVIARDVIEGKIKE